MGKEKISYGKGKILLWERKNSLIRAQKLSAQRVRNSLRGVVKACRMGAALSIALLRGKQLRTMPLLQPPLFRIFAGFMYGKGIKSQLSAIKI